MTPQKDDIESIKTFILKKAKEHSTDPVTKVCALTYVAPEWRWAVNTIDETLPAKEIERRSALFYATIRHAEENLIKDIGCPDNHTEPVYTTCFPCADCQRILEEHGVTKVYYIDDHFEKDWSKAAHLRALTEKKIEFIKI